MTRRIAGTGEWVRSLTSASFSGRSRSKAQAKTDRIGMNVLPTIAGRLQNRNDPTMSTVRTDSRRLEVERRKHFHAVASSDELRVLGRAPFTFRSVAREKNGDGMQVGTGQAAHPLVRMILPGVAEHGGARDHALAEFLGEAFDRRLAEWPVRHFRNCG
jgi:hypothetical protein